MDLSSLGTLTMLWYGASFLLWFGLDVALLLIALGVVKKNRPDASGLLVVAAVLMLAMTVLAPCINLLGGRFLPMSSFAGMQIIVSGAQAIVRAIGFGLVLAAIVKLADPSGSEPTS